MTPIPLSLYIHIPWCIKKCPYCDFNSHQVSPKVPEQKYIQALLTDLESELPHIWGRPIESIFIGGGTPSLFQGETIDALLCGLRERLPLRPHTEITMEANPGTFEQDRFKQFKEAGINRLSIGIQSFNDQKLRQLGRIHDAQEALNAVNIAKQAGFNHINLDLMFGLPEQTVEQAMDDLQLALSQKPTHLSWYQLTIEENTLFHHQPPTLPDSEIRWEIQQQGQSLLKEYGLQQYEVSAYALNNRQSRHNLNYWQFGDYLGIGAGAHGKLSMPTGDIIRHSKYRHPEKYMEMALLGKARSTEINLEESERPIEFLLNAIRLKEGFSQTLYENRTWLAFSSIQDTLTKAISLGLMKNVKGSYTTTEKGWAFIDNIIEMML